MKVLPVLKQQAVRFSVDSIGPGQPSGTIGRLCSLFFMPAALSGLNCRMSRTCKGAVVLGFWRTQVPGFSGPRTVGSVVRPQY